MARCSHELPSDSESEFSEDSDAEETIDFANVSISGKDVLDAIQTDESVFCCSLGEVVSSAAKKCVTFICSSDGTICCNHSWRNASTAVFLHFKKRLDASDFEENDVKHYKTKHGYNNIRFS